MSAFITRSYVYAWEFNVFINIKIEIIFFLLPLNIGDAFFCEPLFFFKERKKTRESKMSNHNPAYEHGEVQGLHVEVYFLLNERKFRNFTFFKIFLQTEFFIESSNPKSIPSIWLCSFVPYGDFLLVKLPYSKRSLLALGRFLIAFESVWAQ